ncbi:DeoR/GlpR family DNA-binding transcription regulator [Janibacter cremeus]|uniref:DeoR/GlpR family DNA-binding transcription regulator n=1 Tax=Janibacter cremeus TaxID=1285192 RepID=UPI0023F97E64|nr:DeoR/GlpR family DNA-binding transcription regulator [Janibacter cremeus]WEV76665.1 DeoR/GlpR family DNA-binding transcription regulator [Janibacter cremeus]
MYAPERQQRILEVARAQGRVEVLALSTDLGVTTETVRRDLTALERRGAVRRVHGGALPVERLEVEPPLATRTSRNAEAKRRIAARALDEVTTEGTVLLDGGTTTRALAELLPDRSGLTVVTNSIDIAAVLQSHEHTDLYVLGGRVRGRTGATVGDWLVSALADVCVDVALIGANGYSPSRGMTTPDQAEAVAKRTMVRAARRTVVLADSTKAGDDHFHRFADTESVDLLVTDTDLDDDTAAELAAEGMAVVRA